MELSNGGEKRETSELQSQAHVWNQTFSFINSMSLKCAVELGIPDIIHNHGRPMALPDLVSALAIPKARAGSLGRLMRMLTHSGFFARCKVERSFDHEYEGVEEEGEGYVLTPPSLLLRKDSIVSMYPIVAFVLHPLMTQQFDGLSKWFGSDRTISPFEMQHGRAFWDYTAYDPEFNRITNEAMASDAPILMSKIIEKCRNSFEQSTSMIDVGGGTGLLAKGIADAFPNLELTVLDLPHVVHGLEGTKNLNFSEGDMFKSIPLANIILLKWILHDWNDEDCVKILKRCKEAITSKDGTDGSGKLIVIDMVMEDQKEDGEWTETELFFDMLMMAMFTGKERSQKEWAELFLDSGFSKHTITPLIGSRYLIEAYP